MLAVHVVADILLRDSEDLSYEQRSKPASAPSVWAAATATVWATPVWTASTAILWATNPAIRPTPVRNPADAELRAAAATATTEETASLAVDCACDRSRSFA